MKRVLWGGCRNLYHFPFAHFAAAVSQCGCIFGPWGLLLRHDKITLHKYYVIRLSEVVIISGVANLCNQLLSVSLTDILELNAHSAFTSMNAEENDVKG